MSYFQVEAIHTPGNYERRIYDVDTFGDYPSRANRMERRWTLHGADRYPPRRNRRAQAEAVARGSQGSDPTAIYASDLQRAWQTAQAIQAEIAREAAPTSTDFDPRETTARDEIW